MQDDRWARVKDIFAHVSDLTAQERQDYLASACAEDGDLRAEVESLLQAHDTADSFIEEPAAQRAGLTLAATNWIGRRFGPYRIVEELGRGGMSEVYKAVRDDQQYEKQVAIKLLRNGFDSESLLRRFRVERQILAQLSHPNIAHLIDGATTEEGLPYLVMEFIQGKPIDSYCEEKQLGIRARLDLFRALCDAVHYVHQHLMVHGDIKCNNVLVTDTGVVKLLDFGIAKLLNPTPALLAIDPKVTGLIAMTPDYASPEQVRGEPITTSSDVYSLGVVLYRLLTGQLPYRVKGSTSYELATQICEQEPPAPSETAAQGSFKRFARELRGDLDNIVLKALQKSPDQRYGSAEQLAEDVHRYLRGFPVRARSDSTYYRVTKFVRRHRAATAAMSLFVLALLTGIVATSWQAHIANRERARAERHFDNVRKLADTFMLEVNDSLENLPGATAARKLLVENSLKYLSELAKEQDNSVVVLRDLAAAYERIADVQGRFRGANLGDTVGAIDSYRRALEIRESLAFEHDDVELQRDTLRTHGKLSELLMLSEPKLAVEHSRHVVRLASQLSSSYRATDVDRRNLATAYLALGSQLASLDSLDEGIAMMKAAVPVYESLLEKDPNDWRARRNLGLVHQRIGGKLVEATTRYDEALVSLRKSQEIFAGMLENDARNTDLTRIYGYTLVAMADALRGKGQTSEALPLHEESVQLFETMRASDPANLEAPYPVAHALTSMAESLIALGDHRSALKHLSRAETLLRHVFSPDKEQLAENHYYLGMVFFHLGRVNQALANDPSVRPLLRNNHQREAREWYGRSIESLTRATNDAVLSARAAARIAEAKQVVHTLS